MKDVYTEMRLLYEDDPDDHPIEESKLLMRTCSMVNYLDTNMYFVDYNPMTYNDPLLLHAKYLLIEKYFYGFSDELQESETVIVPKKDIETMRTDGHDIFVTWGGDFCGKAIYGVYLDEYCYDIRMTMFLMQTDINSEWSELSQKLESGRMIDYYLDQYMKIRKERMEQIKKYEEEVERKTEEILKIFRAV